MALSARSAYCSPLREMLFDFLSTMGQFGSPHHLATCIIDDGYSGGRGSRIKFQAQHRL
jgi:hypothetical protein